MTTTVETIENATVAGFGRVVTSAPVLSGQGAHVMPVACATTNRANGTAISGFGLEVVEYVG